MTSNHNVEDSDLYAILIGIDHYFPNSLYSSLGGCVRDINHVENFLIRKLKGISSNNILKLTCSQNKENTDKPIEPEEKWPTYENILNVFNRVTEQAKPGDQIYIHYSGHGGRVKTLLTDIKGPNGFDETIVPADIGNPKSRHLRDIEIAALLKKMLDKKLIVTLVIDSCHSGGLTRGRGGAVVRGNNEEDKTPRPQDSLVASKEELEHIWKELLLHPSTSQTFGTTTNPTATDELKSKTRGVSASGWLPQAQGYVLLAACRPSESAYEYAFEGDERNGALTYWFLKLFEQIDKGLTYKIIHDRIIVKVHGQFPLQTPMLEGEGDREVFGTNRIQQVYTVSVVKVDISDNNRILLNAGQTHGIKKGARFAIYPFGISDFSKIDMRLGLVEIDERGATNSWAKIIRNFGRNNIEEGCQAILITPTDISLKRKVRLVYNDRDAESSTLSTSNMKIAKSQALDKIRSFIIEKSKNNEIFLELAPEESDTSHFQVAVNENGEYVIWDPAGNNIPNLNPPLLINDGNSVSKVMQRLEHLTKYSNIQLIDNIDTTSDLYRKIAVELFKVPNDYEPGDRPSDLLPIESEGNMKIANVGQKLILRIKNMSEKVINTTLINLASDWSVSQVYPSSPGANFVPIDPNQEEFFYLDVDLPAGYNEGKDILKVFATLDQASFRWLELPALDQPLLQTVTSNRGGGSRPISPLEQLMAAITNDKPITRNLNPSATPSKEWTTVQLEIKVHRR